MNTLWLQFVQIVHIFKFVELPVNDTTAKKRHNACSQPSINNARSPRSRLVSFNHTPLLLAWIVFKKDVTFRELLQIRASSPNESRAGRSIRSPVLKLWDSSMGKRSWCCESEHADHPIGLICLLSNSLFCGFGIRAMFVLALAKGGISRDD